MEQLLRQRAEPIWTAAIRSVLPDEAVRRALEDFHPQGRVFLVAAGKAAWQMAHAALAVLGRVPQLAPQAFCAVIQPPPDQFLRRGLDPFFQSVLHLGFLFDFIDISHLTPAGRGQGPSLVLLRGQVRGLGGHQFIELRMTGEIVHEGHNGAAALDEAPPKVHIGDVGELVV